MKQSYTLLLSAIVMLSFLGCGGQRRHSAEGTPVSFYYENQNAQQLDVESVVAAETRYYNGFSLQELLELYLKGPETEELLSPFPDGTHVLNAIFSDDHVTLKMSMEFFTLSGIDMSIANYCLANTICSYMDLESVVLTDEMDTIHMEIRSDHYLLSNHIVEEPAESFTVYFADQQRRYLIPETRSATLSENETAVAYVMRQLSAGPESSQLQEIMPSGSTLLESHVQDGICTLNFSHAFYENRPRDIYGAYTTIFGIVNTLTSLPDIHAVIFQDEGVTATQYGIFSLEDPVIRNANAVGPVRTANGEIDVNVYILSEETGQPFAVPCRVEQSISQPLAEAVITQVLNYEAFSGFYNPIPFGTELLNISISGSICYVDVSDAFIPAEDSAEAERAAVWALVTSLTDLDDISSVVLTINGETVKLRYVDISEPLTRKSVSILNKNL